MPKGFKAGGRVAGTPNKATKEFRDTVTALLSDNAQNVAKWLALVAEGDPANEIKPAPEKALDLLAKLAEFAAPKLARTEITGADGGAIKTEEVTRPKLTKAEWLAAHGIKGS
jgi:hypothetical protein